MMKGGKPARAIFFNVYNNYENASTMFAWLVAK